MVGPSQRAPPATGDPHRVTEELGPALKAARTTSGVTQVAVVAQTELSQARLSRIETGKALPAEGEVHALARLYGLDATDTDRLAAMARDAAAHIHDERLVVQRGQTLALQQRWRRLEGEATVVRSFQPALVVGGLQAAGYAATIFGVDPGDPLVVERVKRQERLLQSGRRLMAIHTEGALRRTIGSPQVMVDQLEHLARLSEGPGLKLGVIPDRVPAGFVVGNAFHIYDDRAVVVGLEVATAQLADPKDVTHFQELFDRLAEIAVFGDEARAEVERTRRWYETGV